MNHIQSIIKIHSRDRLGWIYIPLIIVSSSFFVNLLIGYIFIEQKSYTGGLLSIFAYMLVMGILALVQTFPYAIGMSLRRKDYFIGTSLVAAFSSVICTIFLLLFSFFEQQTGGWGVKLHFFHLPYLNDGTLFQQIVIYFSLFIYLFFLGFSISGIGRRFGKSGMFIFAIVFILIFSSFILVAHNLNWWKDIFQWIVAHSAFELSLWLFPFTIFHMVISYLLLRRATI